MATMKASFYKTLGCILIVTGTAIGAGMLAIPLVTAEVGFKYSALLLLACWALMTFTALLILEVNLAFDEKASFSSMSYHSLGKPGRAITWVSFLLLLYALTAAYITGGTSLLSRITEALSSHSIPSWLNSLLFTGVLGAFVIWGTHAVDYLNRLLMSVKGLTLLLLIILLMPHIHLNLVLSQSQGPHYIFIALPILITSFGFHIVIPSIRQYLGPDPKKLRQVILIGSSLPLIIYLLWDISILGTIPLHGTASFHTIEQQQSSIGGMLSMLEKLLQLPLISASANLFSDVAITTSFLGVSLGLYDFIIDGLRLKKNTSFGKTLGAAFTFGLPLGFALFYPQGFILALNYASIFVVILLIILPVLMVYCIRQHNKPQIYRVKAGNAVLASVLVLGLVLLALELMISFNGIHT
ncbi:MAG: tyrosine-specific transport protein [Gammaproteobacteria bacterium]|jgi:tyrosine-specific transport protein|nr:tyrosine-specific transport protein [Gammaproteobacteria bacterium]